MEIYVFDLTFGCGCTTTQQHEIKMMPGEVLPLRQYMRAVKDRLWRSHCRACAQRARVAPARRPVVRAEVPTVVRAKAKRTPVVQKPVVRASRRRAWKELPADGLSDEQRQVIVRQGERVRNVRALAHLSRRELAGMVGRDEGWITAVEDGRVRLTLGHVSELCAALHCDPVAIMGGLGGREQAP